MRNFGHLCENRIRSLTSVADPGCLHFIQDPTLSIPDPGLTRSRICIKELLIQETETNFSKKFSIPDLDLGVNKEASDPGTGTWPLTKGLAIDGRSSMLAHCW
jgi:hypothetical protein